MPIGIFTPTDQLAQAFTPDEEKKAGAERAGEGRQHEFFVSSSRGMPGVEMQPKQRRTAAGMAMNLRGSVWQIIFAATMYIFLVSLYLALLCPLCVAQSRDRSLSLPHLETCQDGSHPVQPEKWRGAFLMAPFTSSQLVLSEIVYDGSVPAMLVNLYGVRSGSARVFVLGNRTYLLPQHGSDGQCEELGDTGWTPLPRDWLAEGSQCAGSAQLSEISVQWWKTPTQPAPLANWIWFKTSDQSPFRLLWTYPGLVDRCVLSIK